MSRDRLFIVILMVTCWTSSCTNVQESKQNEIFVRSSSEPSPIELTESEAIASSERFIAQNGYTNIPPERQEITLESIEPSNDQNVILKMRHNTLEPKAFGVLGGRKGGAPGWTVVFRYRRSPNSDTARIGRAVTMNLDGTDTRVEHVDILLDKVAKKLKT